MVSRVRLFGLTIASEIPLPGLVPAPEHAAVDVNIRRGTVAVEGALTIEKVANFAIRDGREIIVDAQPGVPERNVRLFLLGSAMGMLLHQRGLFPLHANAVYLEAKAIAVAGASGSGKSTLATWFSRQGLPLVGDDVIVLKSVPGGTVALPGPPRVRLWRQSLEKFGLGSDGLEPSYTDADHDKWDLPVPISGRSSEEVPLAAIYVLEDGPEIVISPMSGAATASALFEHTYRGGYVKEVGGAVVHWQTVSRIAASIPAFRLARPRDLSQLETLGRSVLDHAAAEVARTSASDRSAGRG